MIRTRFAPSPTGYLHCGNVRTALFNTLMAQHGAGNMILRIEDTDQSRSTVDLTHAILTDLKWLDLHWQGEPSHQSERTHIYTQYFQILQERHLTYPCFCSEEAIAIYHKLQLSRGEPPRYPGTCAALTQEEVEAQLLQGKKPAWRFRVPAGQVVEFEDLVRGNQQFQSDTMGDFIIRRADGTSPFLFSNAIDDALMEVTHVLRGEDHVANTPRQLMLLAALSLPAPRYGHLPLIVGEGGSPLSKREGSFSIHDLRQKGYLPLAILNYLARLGCTFESNELMSLKLLGEAFQPTRLGRSPAHFDVSHLCHWQKQAVMKLSAEELQHWLASVIPAGTPAEISARFFALMQQNILFPEEAALWADIIWGGTLPYTPEQLSLLAEAGRSFFEILREALTGSTIQQACQLAGKQAGLSGKKLYQPVRVALTGRTDGPELAHIAALMGVEALQHRIDEVINLLNGGTR